MPSGAVELPAPLGGGLSELDLPMPAATSDLPALSGAVDLPTPSAAVDLPIASQGLDLPGPADALQMPSSPRPEAPSRSDGLELPDISNVQGGPADDAALDFGDLPDLELPDARSIPPAGPGSMPPASVGDELELPSFDDPDDLSLPEPRVRGEEPGAGGPSYGEIELDDGGSNDALEFDELPQETRTSGVGGEADLDMELPDEAAVPTPRKAVPRELRDDAPKKKKRKRTGLIATAVILAAVVAVGVGLKWTPHGIFGIYYLERFRPEAGSAASAQQVISDAEALAAGDTYLGARAGLAKLSTARKDEYLNRTLLARSAMHEAYFQIRFGEDSRALERETSILERLRIRGNDAPGMDLALGASAIRAGRLDEGTQRLARAPNSDLYVHLLRGERALAAEEGEAALAAFAAATENAPSAAASWGTARAHLLSGALEPFEAAARQTLELSPTHAGALTALARRANDDGRTDEALALAQQAAGRQPVGEQQVQAEAHVRADALTLIGHILETRRERRDARQAYEGAIAARPFQVDALLGLGRLLLFENRFRDAFSRFETAETAAAEVSDASEGQRSPAIQARVGQVEALIALDQVQQARSKIDEIATDSEDALVVYWQGRSLQALEQIPAARQAYQRAIELDSTRFDTYLALAQLHLDADEDEDAAAVLTRAREAVEMTSDIRVALGNSELRRGRFGDAEREFRAALAMDSGNADARFGLGTALRRGGSLSEAAQVLDQLAAADPDFSGLALERGRIYEAQGQSQQAVRSYQRALEDRPEDLDLLVRLGGAQVNAGELDEAEATLNRVRQERPDSPEAAHFIGRIAFERDELPAALRHLERAVGLEGHRGEFHVWLGWAQLRNNRLGPALQSAERALELDSTLGNAYFVRGRVHLRTGAVQDALSDFEQAVAHGADAGEAHAAMGEAFDQMGKRSDAIRVLRRAVDLRPTRGEWYFRLGRFQMESGDRRAAAASLSRSVELADALDTTPAWGADAHRVLADAHRLGGARGAALEHYRKYLELAPPTALDRREVEERVRDLTR